MTSSSSSSSSSSWLSLALQWVTEKPSARRRAINLASHPPSLPHREESGETWGAGERGGDLFNHPPSHHILSTSSHSPIHPTTHPPTHPLCYTYQCLLLSLVSRHFCLRQLGVELGPVNPLVTLLEWVGGWVGEWMDGWRRKRRLERAAVCYATVGGWMN